MRLKGSWDKSQKQSNKNPAIDDERRGTEALRHADMSTSRTETDVQSNEQYYFTKSTLEKVHYHLSILK